MFIDLKLRVRPISALLLIVLFASGSAADVPRSASARRAFVRENPCPATGERKGACPGWVVDHIAPLCAGGADHASNMQWQTREDAKSKDREENALCRARAKGRQQHGDR